MICISLQGGLGNQMFQFAAAYSLAIKHEVRIEMSSDLLDLISPDRTTRSFELNIFGLEVVKKNRYKKSRILSKVTLFNKNIDYFFEKGIGKNDGFSELGSNSLIEGYFQSENYFRAIKPELYEVFRFPNLSHESKKIKESIKLSNSSVSLHIRRGDYVALKQANSFHGVLGIEYYKSAISKLSENSNYFIFSDDIDWCKANLSFIPNLTFIDRQEKCASWEDMALMSCCEHNIIANSSYSWWAAWLNKNQNKTVIAPKNWFNDEAPNQSALEIVPNDWIKV